MLWPNAHPRLLLCVIATVFVLPAIWSGVHHSTRLLLLHRPQHVLQGNPISASITVIVATEEGPDTGSDIWAAAPAITILARVFAGAADELWNQLMFSHLLFWPASKWTQSDLAFVWDGESQLDHGLATVLGNLPPFPKMFFEKRPPNGTLCSNWRHEGYSRQMYSSFYADLYTNNTFVGLVDSDSSFVAQVHPDALFDHVNGQWKPRVIGYNGCCTGWLESIKEVVGQPAVGEFMVVIGFPVIIQAAHLPGMREHIRNRMNATTFEEAFNKICSKYPAKYSQFDIMMTYLWYFKRGDYSWHLKDAIGAQHGAFSQRVTDAPDVLQHNIPKAGVMKHAMPDAAARLALFSDYLCVASDWAAGDCATFKRDDVEFSVMQELGVDWQYAHAAWQERGRPGGFTAMREIPWVSPTHANWNETYEVHKQAVNYWRRDHTWRQWD